MNPFPLDECDLEDEDDATDAPTPLESVPTRTPTAEEINDTSQLLALPIPSTSI